MNKKEIQEFLRQNKLYPIKRFGQNFLVNPHIIKKIAQTVQKHSPPFVEVGPGLGALSRHFENQKKAVFLVERDKKLAEYWKKAGWAVLRADILKLKWEELPDKFTLFGNLPYQVASSLIIKSSLCQSQVSSMVFTLQKEVAQRVTACPGKNYGLLSVLSQVFWKIHFVADIPKTNFYPAPKVDGRVLEFQPTNRAKDFHPEKFLKFVKRCFAFKRKMLFKQISSGCALKYREIFKNLNLKETCRAEDLKPSQFVELYLQGEK